MKRARIAQPLHLGVRAIDTLTTVGRGQRLGLFAGSGVGKSSLLSMVAHGTEAAVSVIALVGERGREVREFLEDDLGEAGLARSVVVVSTSDEPALMRLRAAFVATRIAEAFRDAGAHVMLMMDSLTRVAMAQREIGLSVGEPPATRGYPPSTFSLLAGLLERAGTAQTGSITGIYTVLVDGDDHNEPVADAVRSVLDGHIVLDRRLSVMGHFPSIDVLASISRLATKVATDEQRRAAGALRSVLAARQQARDLLDVGAYQAGSNPLVDAAVQHGDAIDRFLRQDLHERTSPEDSWARLAALVDALGVA
jgi:flagellum-specific ATP synthase